VTLGHAPLRRARAFPEAPAADRAASQSGAEVASSLAARRGGEGWSLIVRGLAPRECAREAHAILRERQDELAHRGAHQTRRCASLDPEFAELSVDMRARPWARARA
jgi:hypothetical protein